MQLDSCQQGGCLNRGHLYEGLLPLLEETKVDVLPGDSETKIFSAKGREEFARPLLSNQYQSVPNEALNYNNFQLNVDSLLQSRLDRSEAQSFRTEIRQQAIFDGCIGILFLAIVVYRLLQTIWEYVNQNFFEKNKMRNVGKRKDDARIFFQDLVNVANENRQHV